MLTSDWEVACPEQGTDQNSGERISLVRVHQAIGSHLSDMFLWSLTLFRPWNQDCDGFLPVLTLTSCFCDPSYGI